MISIYENQLPTGWEQDELRKILLRKRGYSWSKEDEVEVADDSTVPVVRIPNVQQRKLDLSDLLHLRNVPHGVIQESAVTKDWILMVGSNGNPARIGDSALMTEDRPMIFASFLMAIASKDPNRITPKFLSAWMRLHRVHEAFSRTSQQTTGLANLSWSAVKRLPLRFPSNTNEQNAITNLLDSVDKAIEAAADKLWSAQRLKTALMQQLFTLGMPNRHNRFQQTKIGEFPSTWKMARIQSVLDGPPFNGVSPQSRPEPPGTPILNVSCINEGLCTTDGVSYADVDEATLEECRAVRGDFYVLRGNGNRDYVATGGLLTKEPDVPTIFSDKLIRLRFRETEVVERFLPYLWQSKMFLHRLQSKAESGSGLWMMSKRDIRRELFAYPESRDEQQSIVSLMDASIEQISACQLEVDACERMKQALLQNLLTGRVRVQP